MSPYPAEYFQCEDHKVLFHENLMKLMENISEFRVVRFGGYAVNKCTNSFVPAAITTFFGAVVTIGYLYGC